MYVKAMYIHVWTCIIHTQWVSLCVVCKLFHVMSCSLNLELTSHIYVYCVCIIIYNTNYNTCVYTYIYTKCWQVQLTTYHSCSSIIPRVVTYLSSGEVNALIIIHPVPAYKYNCAFLCNIIGICSTLWMLILYIVCSTKYMDSYAIVYLAQIQLVTLIVMCR